MAGIMVQMWSVWMTDHRLDSPIQHRFASSLWQVAASSPGVRDAPLRCAFKASFCFGVFLGRRASCIKLPEAHQP
eukprot:3650676-Amphidinium_carterae.1